MKTMRRVVLGFLFGFGLGMTVHPVLRAAKPPQDEGEASHATSDHLLTAVALEEKAKAEEALIAQHRALLKNAGNVSIMTPEGKLEPMAPHCEAIIRDAGKLRDDLLAFARWHRLRAAELKGKQP